jgi:uncharacterized delta-60 repeat protein
VVFPNTTKKQKIMKQKNHTTMHNIMRKNKTTFFKIFSKTAFTIIIMLFMVTQGAQAQTPTAPATQIFCAGATVGDLAATTTGTGAEVKSLQWYEDATTTTILDPTDALASATYYVAQKTPQTITTLSSGFNVPHEVAIEADGSILVADNGNQPIQRMTLDTDGNVLTTVNINAGFIRTTALAVEASGSILVADSDNNLIKRLILGTDGLVSTIETLASGLDRPGKIAIEADGNILVVEPTALKRITLDVDGNFISINTLRGGFSSLTNVAVEADGSILIIDSGAENIQRITLQANGAFSSIETLPGNFYSAIGIAVQADGKILVAIRYQNTVIRMDADGSNFETLVNSGLSFPEGMALQADGSILVADASNNAIKRITLESVSDRVAVGVTVGVPAPTGLSPQVYSGTTTLADLTTTGTNIKWYNDATAGTLLANSTPTVTGTTYYASQTVNTCESAARLAIRVNQISEATQAFCTTATVADLVSNPSTSTTTKWYDGATKITPLDPATVLTTAPYYVEQIATSQTTTVTPLGSGFSNPSGVAVAADGSILVADYANSVIQRMNADGTNIVTLGSGFIPYGVAVEANGTILVADYGNNAIKRMNADGTNIVTLGSGFFTPAGVAVDADGKIIVADYGNNAIKRMNADGTNIVTLIKDDTNLKWVAGVAIQTDGRILITQQGRGTIKRINADGSGLVTLATPVNNSTGVAVQADGRILIADYNTGEIKRINADGSGLITLASGFSTPCGGITIQADGSILVAHSAATIKKISLPYSSKRVMVSVKIGTVAPTGLNKQVYSGTATLADVTATGTTIQWYDDATVGTLLDSNTTVTDGTTYYASQTINSCESTTRFAVTMSKISEVEQTVLCSGTIANLVSTPSTAATVAWYEDATTTTPLDPATALTTATYYVEQITPETITSLASGFTQINSIAVEVDGSILVVDYGDKTIKRITLDTDGNAIETVTLGSGYIQPYGVAVQADGKILVTDIGSTLNDGTVKRMDADGSNIETISGGFRYPYGIAIEADGSILVTDDYEFDVRAVKRMDADGNNTRTLGSGFRTPSGVAVQADGRILVADSFNRFIKRMDADGSNIVTLGSADPYPWAVAVQADGKILAGYSNFSRGTGTLRRMNADGTGAVTLATGLPWPRGIALEADGSILLTAYDHVQRITLERVSNRVAVNVTVNTTAAPTSVSTQVYSGTATLADLSVTGTAIQWYTDATAGTALATNTTLTDSAIYYATQTLNSCESTTRLAVTVKKISELAQTFCPATVADLVSTPSASTTVAWYSDAATTTSLDPTDALTTATYYAAQLTPATTTTLNSAFNNPYAVAIEADGSILVPDYDNNLIKRMSADGKTIVTLGSGFELPIAVAVQTDGKILVVNYGNGTIQRMDANGDSSTIETLGSGYVLPYAVAVEADGSILIVERDDKSIKRMDSDGTNIVTLATGFVLPSGVAVEADGSILVTDTFGDAINRMTLDANGDVTAIESLGSGITRPSGVTIQADGSILFSDIANGTINKMDVDGTNIVQIGNGFNGLFGGLGVAAEADGSILVADTSNDAIKRITLESVSNRAVVNVTVNTTASPTGSASQTFCGSETVSFLNVSGTEIIWYDAVSSEIVVPGSTLLVDGTTYYASQTLNSCESSIRLAVTANADGCLGLNNFDATNLQWYPNPTTGILNINYSNNIDEVSVLNMVGQTLFTKKTKATEVQIDFSRLPKATYFMKVVSEGKVKMIKVIKQ